MPEIKKVTFFVKKYVSINELGSGDVTISHEYKNNDTKDYFDFGGVNIDEYCQDVVDIQISDNKGKIIKSFEKETDYRFTTIKVIIDEKIMPL